MRPPILGRYLAPDECDLANPARVAVLNESAWRSRFSGAADVVGRTIHLNRLPFTVVGVAPSLLLPGRGNDSELWVPYTMLGELRPSDEFFADPLAQWLIVTGRRKPDHSRDAVEFDDVLCCAVRSDA